MKKYIISNTTGKYFSDGKITFDKAKLNTINSGKNYMINAIAMLLAIVSFILNLQSNFKGITNIYSIVVIIFLLIAILVFTLSVINYFKVQRNQITEFSTNNINKVKIKETNDKQIFDFQLKDIEVKQIICTKDKSSECLINFLKESEVELVYE